jgi:5-methylcytosine-specific restriction endonuclease McrA
MPRRRRISAAVRRQMMERDRQRCAYCRSPMFMGIPMVIEHIVPLVRGGSSTFDNLCLACYRCNEFVRRENGNDDTRLKRGRLTEGADLQVSRLTQRRKPKGTIACR